MSSNPPPIVSFTPEGVRQGLCHLATYERGYVRLGALKAIGQMLGLHPSRASGQSNQPEPPSGHPFAGFDYRPAAADSQAAQQAAEAQQAESETEGAQTQDEANSEDDEDQSATQEDEPP